MSNNILNAILLLFIISIAFKLYLNSFNMTRLGDCSADCMAVIEARVKEDLDKLLETNTTVSFYSDLEDGKALSFEGYTDLGEIVDLDQIDFTAFSSDASQLEIETVSEEAKEVKLRSNLLRSNCRVTNQPDWGDVFIKIIGKNVPTAESIAKYIVSHRTVSHFHEEICEMIFAHLTERFGPDQLMVSCLYTRRGGIDINPIRATHSSLIPEFFTNPEYIIRKTLRHKLSIKEVYDEAEKLTAYKIVKEKHSIYKCSI